MRFAHKVAIVTGGGSGIGLATVKRLASEGARVIVAGRNVEAIRRAADAAREAGAPDALPCPCDVGVEGDVGRAAGEALARFGRLDVVVNNAGTMVFAPIEALATADVLRVLHVDFLAAVWFTQHLFRHGRPGSSVVNVSSIHSVQTTPLVSAYAAAKAAMNAFTRASAIEGKPKGIRANVVLPGAIETPMLRDNPNVRSGAEVLDEADVGRPEDVAAAIAFLASDEAAFVTGAEFRVDGGRLARL